MFIRFPTPNIFAVYPDQCAQRLLFFAPEGNFFLSSTHLRPDIAERKERKKQTDVFTNLERHPIIIRLISNLEVVTQILNIL